MDSQQIINQCIEQVKKIYPTVQIPPIMFNRRMRTTAGRVHFQRRNNSVDLVELNPNLLTTKDRLESTLMHELAHVIEIQLCGFGGHGRTWQMVMKRLNRPITRCHQYSEAKDLRRKVKRYKATCGCEKPHEITGHRVKRMENGCNYRCRKCKERIELCR